MQTHRHLWLESREGNDGVMNDSEASMGLFHHRLKTSSQNS